MPMRMPCHSCHGRAERPTATESATSSASAAGWSSLTVKKLDSSLGELSCRQTRENGRHTRDGRALTGKAITGEEKVRSL